MTRSVPHLRWQVLKDWRAEQVTTSPYVIVLGDRQITESFGCDHGIAAQTILLAADRKGFGAASLASIQKNTDAGSGRPERANLGLLWRLVNQRRQFSSKTLRATNDIKYTAG